MASTVVIGLGNSVVSDDGVGSAVVRHIRRELGGSLLVSLVELQCGGIELMEAMIGYERAFVIDAMTSGAPPGTVRQLAIDQVGATRNAYSTHHGSLATALELGRIAGVRLPSQVFIWGVEAGDLVNFSEQLTPPVRAAVPIAAAAILEQLLPNTEGAS